jgi:pimeloyl-ACP methyl ester carboxylesterase
MPAKKPSRPAPAKSAPKPSAFQKAMEDLRNQPPATFTPVSGSWLLKALGAIVVASAACAWLVLCLLFWQGNWQLLYHPSATIVRTPASVGLAFEPVKFATTETGITQLTGWWVPVTDSRYTVLYFHGAEGNLSNTVDMISSLHSENLNVFAIDYRGYGQSQPVRPSEKQLRQDAEWALTWLTVTRNIPAKQILIAGSRLGANLAVELAVDHGETAGVILDQPLLDAMAPVLNDRRSHLVPASWMVHDRYDLTAATQLRIPSLWLFDSGTGKTSLAYAGTPGQKSSAFLQSPAWKDPHLGETLKRWLDDLPLR